MKPYEAETLGNFLRKVAYDYARYGYTEYAVREIPHGKDVRVVWEKLVREYRITYCHTKRARRRKQGMANVVLVSYKQSFILMGTPGEHETWGKIVKQNLKVSPLHFQGYSIGMVGDVPEVRIAGRRWRRVEEIGRAIALHNERKVNDFFHRFLENVCRYSFPGVVRQKQGLLREVNQRRRKAGLPPVEAPVMWWKREPQQKK